jgi:hypothetical protein
MFYSRAYDALCNFEGLIAAGELNETLKLFVAPGRRLRRNIGRFIAEARASRHRNSASALANMWLEAQFGWKPLVSDIASAAEALAKFRPQIQRVSSWKESSRPGNPSSVAGTFGTHVRIQKTIVEKFTVSCRCVGGVLLDTGNGGNVAEKWGLGAFSWAPASWELIPYSFVIDYFSNMGKLIEAFAFPSARLVWSSETTCRKTSRSFVATFVAQGHGTNTKLKSITSNNASYEAERLLIERKSGVSLPTFSLKLPAANSLKWINLAALVASRNHDATSRRMRT